jgi:hypothetical protein
MMVESSAISESRLGRSNGRVLLPINEVSNINRRISNASKLPPALLEERMRISTASLNHIKLSDPPIPVIKLSNSNGSSFNNRVRLMHEYPINNEQEVNIPQLRLDIHIDIY